MMKTNGASRSDILIKSIIDCSEEHIEKIEVTTSRDVIETTIWLDEMDESGENQGAAVVEEQQNISDASVYFDASIDDEKDHENTTDEIDLVKNDESAFHPNNEEASIYPDIEKVRQFGPDLVRQELKNEEELCTSDVLSKNKDILDEDDLPGARLSGDNKKTNGTELAIKSDISNALNNGDNVKHKNDNPLNLTSHPSNGGDKKKDEEDFFIPNKTKETASPFCTPTLRKKPPSNRSSTSSRNGSGLKEELAPYSHPNYSEFSTISKRYFKLLQRYHIGDTLPVYFRGQLQMQLRAVGANRLTLGLFGQPGSGKSAFLNSLYTAMNGYYVEYSAERKSDGDYVESATNKRVELRLTETITVLDNRATDFSKDSMKEVIKQCEGYRENGAVIPDDWNTGCKQQLKDLFDNCSKWKLFRNRVQTPILVNSLKEDFEFDKYKLLITTITTACGFSPIIILTHSDTLTEQDRRTDRIKQFEHLNCPRVFTVTNYTYKNTEHDNGIDDVMIEILFNCCLVGDQEMQYLVKKLNRSCCCS